MEIWLLHNTDKAFYHKYLDMYERLLSGLDIKSVLEIWVYEWASIRMWHDYYPDARIIGVDINDMIPIPWCDLIKADATTQEFADSIDDIDFVIDDWSHWSDQQIAAFKLLWPKTKKLYIIEDVYQDMTRGNMACIEFMRQFAVDNDLEIVEYRKNHGDKTYSMSVILYQK